MKDAPIMSRKQESVSGMGQLSKLAAMKVAPTKLVKGESVRSKGQSNLPKSVAMKDAPTQPEKGEFVGSMGQSNLPKPAAHLLVLFIPTNLHRHRCRLESPSRLVQPASAAQPPTLHSSRSEFHLSLRLLLLHSPKNPNRRRLVPPSPLE